MAKRIKQENETHIHFWFTASDPSHQLCNCGCILVSNQEWKRRKEEWDNYFVRVRETESYKRFFEQKEAWKRGEMVVVKTLGLEAKKDLKEKCDMIDGEWVEKKGMWLEKPHFPDPITWAKYRIYEEKKVEEVHQLGI